MEADNELKGSGNSYTTEFRQYDPRLGKWLSADPVTKPWTSPYVAFGNNPVYYNDPRGADEQEGPESTPIEPAKKSKSSSSSSGGGGFGSAIGNFISNLFSVDAPYRGLKINEEGIVSSYAVLKGVADYQGGLPEADFATYDLTVGEGTAYKILTAWERGENGVHTALYHVAVHRQTGVSQYIIGAAEPWHLDHFLGTSDSQEFRANGALAFSALYYPEGVLAPWIIRSELGDVSGALSAAHSDAWRVENVVAAGGVYIHWLPRFSPASIQSFPTFESFKKTMGPAGKKMAWHHIVEQNPGNIAKFGAEAIHNTNNIVPLPHYKGAMHMQISGYYSSIQPFTGGLRVRQWVSTKSFQYQYDFGIRIMKQYGWTPPHE